MKSKNFTEEGYRMHYKKGSKTGPYKNKVLQFRIELPEILPLIWRRIQVPSDYNFWDLHVAIQDAMGWMDTHLHNFEIKGKRKKKEVRIGIPDFEGFDEDDYVNPGWEIPVIEHFNDVGVEAKYQYDYGDSWWHTVKLEAFTAREKGQKYPLCLDGAQACPPEDCGGEPGYYNLVEILSNPDHDEHEEMKQWVGDWDPDAFNKDKVGFEDPYKRWELAFLEEE